MVLIWSIPELKYFQEIIVFYVCGSFACILVCVSRARVPWRPEEGVGGVGVPATGVREDCEPSCRHFLNKCFLILLPSLKIASK